MPRPHRGDRRSVLGAFAVLAACCVLSAVLGGATAIGWASAAMALLCAVSLGWSWRRSTRSVDRSVRLSLTLAAVGWLLGELVRVLARTVLDRPAAPLSFSDLFLLAALVPLAFSFVRAARQPSRFQAVVRYVLDTYVCVAALLVIGWVTVFEHYYVTSGQPPGAFLVSLIYPVVDAIVLCGALPMIIATPHRRRRVAVLCYVVVVALTVSDVVETVVRLGGTVPPGIAHVPRALGYLLLAAAPWLTATAPQRRAEQPRTPGTAVPASRAGALRAPSLPPLVPGTVPAVVAALVTVVFAARLLVHATPIQPVLAIAAATTVVALAVRLLGLAVENSTLRRRSAADQDHFYALTETIGDVMVISDRAGVVRYARGGGATYGYEAASLSGRSITEVVHPDDWPAVRARIARMLRTGESPVTVTARVVAADGTWLHTEATVTRYRRPGEGDGLLVTARDLSDQVALQQQVDHLTFHDGLTGLPNRAYYEERVREVLARGRGEPVAACVFIDLDGFTAVNDSAGHAAGDYLLGQVARRLRAEVTSDETVARWGSDEFAVLVENPSEARAVVDLADRIAEAISAEPFHVTRHDLALSASIGVAFADRGAAASEVIRNADVAMARAKESGGGRVEVFAVQMHADVVRRIELAADLRHALDEGRFHVEYQPVVELATSRVVGVEALVRWQRVGGTEPADSFIDVAEDTGLIVPLGEWVLREACRQVAQWRTDTWHIGLSVNLSARQITAPNFVDSVAAALAAGGLPGSALTVEVTEEVLVEDRGPIVQRLSELRELGVRLAIDDFGTGYASLAYLRDLPVDVIKIDPSFVAGLGADDTLTLLTSTIVRLGRDLGLVVVAEGIERPEQLTALREMGCGRGQGYLVARPTTAGRVENAVRPAAPSHQIDTSVA